MARVHIEEALLREPNLWVPDSKPIGRVKIDWTHPITKGLVVYFLPQSHSTNRYVSFVNLAREGNPIAVGGTAPSADYVVVYKGKEACQCHPSGGSNGIDHLTIDNGANAPELISNSSDMAAISCGILQGTTVSASRTIWRGNGGDSFRLGWTSSSNFNCSYIDSSPVAQHDSSITTTTIAAGDSYVQAGTKNGNVVKAYLLHNGVYKEGSPTTGGSGTMRDDGSNNRLSLVGTTNTVTHAGWKYVDMIWDRALSGGEMQSIMRDPYQFLIPA